jgi:hypothetical protein
LTGEVDDLLLLFREDELAVPTFLYSMSRQPPVPPSLEKGSFQLMPTSKFLRLVLHSPYLPKTSLTTHVWRYCQATGITP